ncbi:hypothetical protein AB0D04_08735 [Streptomyces sp. NPDC048483]|uniref:hypothetical protein n=1 Tax=Streptomyces sp. NPDC048483 TaxID=3154927 RepID=UPI0034394BC9
MPVDCSAVGKATKPLGPAINNRLANNRVTRPVGEYIDNGVTRPDRDLTDAVFEVQETIEDAADDAVEYMMYGKPMQGSWSSMAGQFLVQVVNAGGEPRAQTITDRGLFVITNHATGRREREPELEVAVEVPRTNIAALRPRPRTTFPRGRFDLVFADGSWIALSCSFQKHMEALVAAFYGR